MPFQPVRLAIAGALILTAVPAAAQFGSESHKFLEAVRDGKGQEVTDFLSKPGSTIINTRDFSTRETALHIVARRGDETYTLFLLQKGADPNLRDAKGNTPLMIAVEAGAQSVVEALCNHRANVDLANDSGETPLIRAVQRRNLAIARVLIDAGADPDQSDSLAGMSARDYANADTRTPALAKLFEDKPKKVRRAVAGPKL